ncbi:MAG: hypothetical protein WDN26_01075 [Chitinophagaceae bacterium]
MKILIDVRDDKAPHVMKVLKGLKFVKTTTISPAKALLLKKMREAVDELNLVKSGKKKARKAENFLHAL